MVRNEDFDNLTLNGDVVATGTDLSTHTGDTTNPHSVTAAQAGALPDTGGSVTGDVDISGALGVGGGAIHQQRGAPTTTELADGERMTYVSDGTDAYAAGDLVSARNNAGTIVSQAIVTAVNDT